MLMGLPSRFARHDCGSSVVSLLSRVKLTPTSILEQTKGVVLLKYNYSFPLDCVILTLFSSILTDTLWITNVSKIKWNYN